MGTLQLQNISLSFGERDLLSHISSTIDTNTKAALAGINGSGKSTLLKIITGSLEPDTGSIHSTKGMLVSYLPQSGIVLKVRSLYEELESAFDSYVGLLHRKSIIESELSESQEHSKKTDNLLEELNSIEEHLLYSNYYQREAKILLIAKGLGFTPEDTHRQCLEFSGGWQMRIALGKILLEQPDLLLLDEPTNYLDVEARVWLNHYLNQYHGGYLLVSHDRYFLDETTNEVLELSQGDLKRYPGTYSAYEKRKELELEQLKKSFEQQQMEINHIESFIDRFRYKASKAKQVQSRVKQLEKIIPIRLPFETKSLRFTFPEPPHSGNDIFKLEKLQKSYGSNHVIVDLNLHIQKGDRIAISGKNGMGKTTLLNILADKDSSFQGVKNIGAGISIGYFAQDTDAALNDELTIFKEVEVVAPSTRVPQLRSLLGSFLFHGDDIQKSISILSGGEKSRVSLLKILLQPVNVLILDEPTNHLDLASKDMLLRALDSYKGTLIFVSHDIDFIKQLATKILYLSEDGADLFEGDYEYFSWKLNQKQLVEAEEKKKETPAEAQPKKQLDRQERNRLKNRLRTLQKEETLVLEQIDAMETTLSKLHHQMSLPENYSNGIKAAQITRAILKSEEDIELFSQKWDDITSEIEEIKHEVDR